MIPILIQMEIYGLGLWNISQAITIMEYLLFSDALGTVKVVDSGYGITNGPIMDRKNQFLFHTDSKKGLFTN